MVYCLLPFVKLFGVFFRSNVADPTLQLNDGFLFDIDFWGHQGVCERTGNRNLMPLHLMLEDLIHGLCFFY